MFKKLKNNKYTIIIILLFVFVLSIYFYCYGTHNLENMDEYKKIPKKIWTFWDSEDLPPEVQTCTQTWKKQNPDYEINILNPSNLSNFLPDVDFKKMKHNDSVQRYSDLVRLHILAKYGGIWSDASILCLKPFDTWIPPLQEKNNAEFIGFYLEKFTLPEYTKSSPVIESWFFACTENSPMVKDWLNEFLRIHDFETVQKYVDSVISEGVNLQNIDYHVYLAIHVSCQKILQKGSNIPYIFEVLKAEDTAYKYLTKTEWNSEKSVQQVINCKKQNKIDNGCDVLDTPIIKLRGGERGIFKNNDYSVFS